MHLHGNCFSLRVILSEFYWINKCKCAISTSLEGWLALTDSLTQWVAASRPPVCHLLHQNSISERAIKNKGRCYKPDFLWKQVKKKTEQQLPVNQAEIPPTPTSITAARRWSLSLQTLRIEAWDSGWNPADIVGEGSEVGMGQRPQWVLPWLDVVEWMFSYSSNDLGCSPCLSS